MIRRPTLVVIVWLLELAASPGVFAQTADDAHVHRFEVAAGGLWLGSADLGAEDADLRANRTPSAPFRLFSTDTRADSASGFDGHIGYWLTRSLAVEAGFVFSRPALSTRVTGDAEGAPALAVEEKLDQYFIDAGVVWLIERLRIGQKTVPFVSGGAGYLRQLHEGQTLIETGQVYHVGGGVRYWLRQNPRARIHGMGVRIEGRAYILSSGVQFEERGRTHGALSASFFVTL